jgi:Excalibur calcium-binding domain
MKKLIAVFVAAVALLVVAAPAGAHRSDPKDCSDFSTQSAAQHWFLKHHPRQDPAGLDADHDGIACEDLASSRVISAPDGILLERRATPPNVVGLLLPVAGEKLRAAGWTPVPFNTDTLFGIVVPSHYTVCHEYAPIGHRVRILAQKYGC